MVIDKAKTITRGRQTKILATLGPASDTKDMIRDLFVAGVDNFRLNFSHGAHDDHRKRLEMIRAVEKEFSASIGVVADMQGPKLRVGRFKDGKIALKEGMVIRFDLDETPGDETRVNLPHPEIIGAVNVGDMLLIDDGKVRVEIIEKGTDYLDVKVVAGQKLSNNKGVNVPGVILPIAALTDKDRKDLSAALDMGVDWIAQSFVQRPEDVAEARKLIAGRAGLIAKIEKPAALETFDEILDHVDAIMLARGDLGVEIPPEDVPAVQKQIVRRVRQAGKPIIIATQMLESMIESPAPTRAEASDVATAVYDGTDSVMLSAETAAGAYPLEAVAIMDRICHRTEADDHYLEKMEAEELRIKEDASDAISAAAHEVAKNIGAACIINYTSSGSTTLRSARLRPSVPILSLSHNLATARRMSLSYGVYSLLVEDVHNTDGALERAKEIVLQHGIAEKGQRLVLTAGVPFGTPGSTNLLRVAWVN
ncbi:MAG: pyruvate kinase [Alphaproteobacteria bacterium]|jgi:pyruvate kinase|nr:pyruvate kinase [Alphaproteobacteria bacterium]MDP7222155.1 pyruvate kinase [Alphaproteobacteria bacterium]